MGFSTHLLGSSVCCIVLGVACTALSRTTLRGIITNAWRTKARYYFERFAPVADHDYLGASVQ